jgi:hypothetical protein
MADASTDSPGLLESALAFIKGETVAKSLLVAAQAKAAELATSLATATARVKELEDGRNEDALESQRASSKEKVLTEQLAAATAKILKLEGEAATAGRRAAQILAGTGVEQVKTSTETARESGSEETFPTLVNAQVKAGKTKVEAIRIVMAENPKAYATYLTVGGKI